MPDVDKSCEIPSAHILYPFTTHIQPSTTHLNPSNTHKIPISTHPKSLQGHRQYASQRNGICLELYGSILDLIIGSKLWINQNTRDIIAAAVRALDRIWVNGHRYAKAGCMLNDFTPTGVSQLNLFDEVQPRERSEQLMKVLDGINHSGLGKVWFAGRGIAPEWQMKREMLSPAYTTRWSDIPCASI